MFTKTRFALILILSALTHLSVAQTMTEQQQQRSRVEKTYNEGNYQQAYAGFQQLVLDPHTPPDARLSDDLYHAVNCLQQLAQTEKIDALLEQTLKVHTNNWRVVAAVAQQHLAQPHDGYIIDNQFHRGHDIGKGKRVNATARDRVRALQLYQQALVLAQQQATAPEIARLHIDYAAALLYQHEYAVWRLQLLTDLDTLPDYDDQQIYYSGRSEARAPAQADGKPVFFTLPTTYAKAENDAQRWRWLLEQAQSINPQATEQVTHLKADFFRRLYGEQTLTSGYGYSRGRHAPPAATNDVTHLLSVRDLSENETMAHLASGIQRFKLPDEFNYILLYKKLASGSDYRSTGLQTLAEIFENRQQYSKAAAYWRQLIEKDSDNADYRKERLQAIIAPWGEFETGEAQAAGDPAKLQFRFRNGKQLAISIAPIKIDRLLNDVKKYVSSNPQNMDYDKYNIENIGYRLVEKDETRYLGKPVANWDETLEPLADHFDRRVEIKTPISQSGAYLVTATLKDGNVSRIIIWLNDTVVIQKNLDNKTFYFVADAKTGKPIADMNLDFFGYQRDYVDLPKPLDKLRYKTTVEQFNKQTDNQGFLILAAQTQKNNFSWLLTATNAQGRFAYLGFHGIWSHNYSDQPYSSTNYLAITDRPVYRPNNTVKFKVWLQQADYNQIGNDKSIFANRDVEIEIYDPRAQKLYDQTLHTDAFGGVSAELALAADATLGVYTITAVNYSTQSNATFRVEEYKKPEFEVTVQAPTDSVQLGDTITANITAKYYYGQPVSNGTVKYKIYRYSHDTRWYPTGHWDWLYGNGYGWFAYDLPWYPGWQEWGCFRPIPYWLPQSSAAPELVAENTLPLNKSGVLEVRIDTALAKQLYGDQDHRYQITAEVTDASRRTITGSSAIIVTREPFKVFAWVDKGYYLPGNQVTADFKAHTAQQTPVQGKGELQLYKVSYPQNQPVKETVVQHWRVNSNTAGEVQQRFIVTEAGQYRVALTVTNTKGQTVTGGYVFTVTGTQPAADSVRFNPLELIADKREYSPDEQAALLINTQDADQTVVLFERPVNGVYKNPILINNAEKSSLHYLHINHGDMPNFFVEAFTVRNGKIFTELREIIVPPAQQTLDITVTTDKPRYQPGEKMTVKVKVRDEFGKPVRGSTVLTVYDKAVEYISGGSNVPDIRKHFWGWRRTHSSAEQSNTKYYFTNLLKRKETGMRAIGVLGQLLGNSDELEQRTDHLRSKMEFDATGSAAPLPAALSVLKDNHSVNKVAELKKQVPAREPAESNAAVDNIAVRKQFADTAFWSANVELNQAGEATLSIPMPENLTGWILRAWTMGHGTRVGATSAEATTFKNVLVRLQAPRFFVEKDEVVISANVHNYTNKSLSFNTGLVLTGNELQLLDDKNKKTTIKAQGEARVDWRVKVKQEGEAVIRVVAQSDKESDAMELRFPVYVHGMDKMESFTGSIPQNKQQREFTLNVPQQRRVESTLLQLQYSPTLAGAMVDALPYLVDYPYGCTEQTLSRFLPTVITQNILKKMQVDLADIKTKRINLNAQQLGDPQQRAQQWQRQKPNPVFDTKEVQTMVDHGIQRLLAMQVSDGGWGWFSGDGEHSSPHTTAYVVHGLQLAKQNGINNAEDATQRGIAWLANHQEERLKFIKAGEHAKPKETRTTNDLDAFIYMVLSDADTLSDDMRNYLYRDRKELSVYAKAMFGLALTKQNQPAQLKMLLDNIEQYVFEDAENETAYLKLPNDHYWWYWYGSSMESNAYYLKLLARTQPNSDKAARLAKFLVNNRKQGYYWQSTRDTAVVIEALADYMLASKEHAPDMKVSIYMDNNLIKTVAINKDNLFSFDNRVVLQGKHLSGGAHSIRIEKTGKGSLYYNAYLQYFTLEDDIQHAGLEIKVDRKIYKLQRIEAKQAAAGSHGQAVQQTVEKYERIPLANLAAVRSGDLVEIDLTIDSKNDYEYVIIDDMKAAGFEPMEVRSGYDGNPLHAYVEYRDERVSYFAQQLPRGKHTVRYRLRAEIPGQFSALPTRVWAMYAPELRANADEIKLIVNEMK
jgi:hypothetical protein